MVAPGAVSLPRGRCGGRGLSGRGRRAARHRSRSTQSGRATWRRSVPQAPGRAVRTAPELAGRGTESGPRHDPGWLAGQGDDDDAAARDLIEALHDLLDGFDAGKFDDLEWSWLAQISDLTRTGTQLEAIVLPEDLVGDRLRAQHLPDQVSYNHRLGRVQWVRVLSSARSRRMRSTSDDQQRTHSAVLVGSSQRDGAELREASIKHVEVRISVQQCDCLLYTSPSPRDRT